MVKIIWLEINCSVLKKIGFITMLIMFTACNKHSIDEIVWSVNELEVNGENTLTKVIGDENDNKTLYLSFDKRKGQYEIYLANNPVSAPLDSQFKRVDKGTYKINTNDKTIRINSFDDKIFNVLFDYNQENSSDDKEYLYLKGESEDNRFYLQLSYSFYSK